MHSGEGDDIDDFGALIIPRSVVSIADQAFVDCEFPATKVVLPGGNFTVGSCAFSGCTSLESIEIVDSGKNCFDIGDYAFDGCTGLMSVHFPACVSKVGKGAFAHCSNLREFTVDEMNSISLTVRNGCLCDRLGLTLLACPATFTSVTIPSSVTSIQYGAFMGCDNLTEVTTDPGREDWVAEQMLASGFSLDRVSFNGRRYGTKKWTVMFDLGEYGTRTGGGALEQMVYDGEAAVAPEVQAGDGWTFVRWDRDFSSVSGDLMVTAVYEQQGEPIVPVQKWTVTFDLGEYGTRTGGGELVQEVLDGEAAVAPAVQAKEGWTFVRWNRDFSSVGGNMTVTAVYEQVELETTIGGVRWRYRLDGGGSATIVGAVDAADSASKVTGEVTIPSELDGHKVTSIGEWAFYGCSGLTSVTIPEGVTSIESRAFGCCSGLRSVTIHEGVTSIGVAAFEGCSGLTSVTIPEGVKSIGGSAFDGCSGLTSVTIPSSVTSIGDLAFYAFPSSMMSFSVDEGNSVFCSRNGMLCSKDGKDLIAGINGDVVIPDGVTSIGMGAFQGRSRLNSVVIPSSVTNIGMAAFCDCSGLTSVTIPEGVTSIGGIAFFGCNSLTSMAIPSSVTSIGSQAFPSSMMSFCVDEGNSVFCSRNGMLCSKDGKDLIAGINGDVVIPDGVTSIGNGAFQDCYGLISVTIPSGVTSIGEWTFMNCSGLAAVTMPEGVTSIGDFAFQGCSSLRSVAIPSSVANIGYYAFGECFGLRSMCFAGDKPDVGGEIYANSGSVTTFVREGMSGWGEVPGEWCGRPIEWWDDYPEVYGEEKAAEVDGRTWRYSVLKSGAEILGCDDASGDLVVPAEIDGRTVTSIGDVAFQYCVGLKSVTIPSSVTSIGDAAFSYCSGLTSVTIPSSVASIGFGAFAYCGGLMSVTMPEGVTSIGDVAFQYCVGLKSVTIPSSVTSIGDAAFFYCSGLTSVTIPEGVTSIGAWAFDGCSGLTSVTIPSSVNSIGDNAFVECSSVMSFSVDEGNSVFCSLNGMLSSKDGKNLIAGINGNVVIPDGVVSIGVNAFCLYAGLTEVTIPSSVKSIGLGAFELSGLTNVVYVGDENRIDIAFTAFRDTPYEQTIPFELVFDDGGTCVLGYKGVLPKNLVIPEGVVEVAGLAFSGRSELAKVTIPPSVTSIGLGVFQACENLDEFVVDPANPAYSSRNGLLLTRDGQMLVMGVNGDVVIPDCVTSIGDCAFAGYFGLSSVTIPASVSYIGMDAFYSCYYLTSVCFEGDAPDFYYGLYDYSYYVTTYVREGSHGWGVVPGEWCGRPVRWWTADEPSPIPDVGEDATADEVYAALNGSKDEKLLERFSMILTEEGEAAVVASYNAYRDWAGTVKNDKGGYAGLVVVRNSPTAWTSFALDSARLLERNPTDDDLRIEEFKPSTEGGAFDFTVSIRDVEVGPLARAENLKKTFGLKGATELVPSAFDEANVDIEFGMPMDGKLKFTAEPLDKDAKSFFMKMKVR